MATVLQRLVDGLQLARTVYKMALSRICESKVSARLFYGHRAFSTLNLSLLYYKQRIYSSMMAAGKMHLMSLPVPTSVPIKSWACRPDTHRKRRCNRLLPQAKTEQDVENPDPGTFFTT